MSAPNDFPDLNSLNIVPTKHLFRLNYAIWNVSENSLEVCPNLDIILKKNPREKWETLFVETVIIVRDKKPGDPKSIFYSRARLEPDLPAPKPAKIFQMEDINEDDEPDTNQESSPSQLP